MRLLTLLLFGCLLEANAALPAQPVLGTYNVVKPTYLSFGEIKIISTDYKSIEFSLKTAFDPTPGGDRSNVRNGEIDPEIIPLIGNMALFRSPLDDPNICSILFVFTRPKQLEITQFGECSWFGVGVNASGSYKIQPEKHR